jgi:hypothetical protein
MGVAVAVGGGVLVAVRPAVAVGREVLVGSGEAGGSGMVGLIANVGVFMVAGPGVVALSGAAISALAEGLSADTAGALRVVLFDGVAACADTTPALFGGASKAGVAAAIAVAFIVEVKLGRGVRVRVG